MFVTVCVCVFLYLYILLSQWEFLPWELGIAFTKEATLPELIKVLMICWT